MNIAVIGAGVTGLAAAARLASQGNRVTIFEKNNRIGGRMSQFTKDGFTFDMGPSIVMIPEVYRAVFEECGKILKIMWKWNSCHISMMYILGKMIKYAYRQI